MSAADTAAPYLEDVHAAAVFDEDDGELSLARYRLLVPWVGGPVSHMAWLKVLGRIAQDQNDEQQPCLGQFIHGR